MTDLMTIADVARRSGVAASALRFYEQRGLIASERTGAGHRRFPRAVLRRIAFIVFAQKIGLSLDEIGGELAKLPQNRVPERADWAKLSSAWTSRIDEQIAELQRLRAGAHAMHRLRLPVATAVPPRESRRSRRPRGPGAAVLDRRHPLSPRIETVRNYFLT